VLRWPVYATGYCRWNDGGDAAHVKHGHPTAALDVLAEKPRETAAHINALPDGVTIARGQPDSEQDAGSVPSFVTSPLPDPYALTGQSRHAGFYAKTVMSGAKAYCMRGIAEGEQTADTQATHTINSHRQGATVLLTYVVACCLACCCLCLLML
jgi:hypothetical protein